MFAKRAESFPSRRQVLGRVGAGALGIAIANSLETSSLLSAPQDSPAALNRFPRMVQEYYVRQLKMAHRKRLAVLDKLETKADAQAYVKSIRERVKQSFGPLPEKTPLNTKTTSVVEREHYKIENIIFESRPGFLVTANLYIPKGRYFPLPGVVGTCGHSTNGKAAEAYQSFAQGLAKQGYVVLIYDPISQGERLQYPDKELKSKIRPGVGEHLHAGNQQFLVGDFLGTWRAWDGIRALDCLLERKEVDPLHVGVTGNSGGGTLTTWLCGLEDRWTMAAPSCFVTEFRRNLENELPADTEQCPPRAIALGLDHEDFIAAMAPKPVILLGKERDFFDVRGTEAAHQRLKKLYRLLDAEENISLFVGPSFHGYSQENREAMYGWFNRATVTSKESDEPAIEIEKDETLQCTPNGQVVELKSRTLQSFTKERSQELAKQRKPLDGQPLIDAVSKVLKIEKVEKRPDYRILRRIPSRKYPVSNSVTYAVNTEPGIQAIVYSLSDELHYSRPLRNSPKAILYVSHHSSDVELREDPLVKQLLEQSPDVPFYSCDVRGIGESRPDTCGNDTFLSPYGSDYFYAIHSFVLDRPYVGRKTHDVLTVLRWLESIGHKQVHLVGNQWGSIPATFAALLSKTVNQVTLKDPLESYSSIAEKEFYDWPLSSFLPGVLEEFDLDDCYRALKSKGLTSVNS